MALVTVLLATAFAACDNSGASAGRLQVVAAAYPLAWLVEGVAAGRADVVALAPAGAEPHDLELTPRQVGVLADADLAVYVGGGFQPGVEDALASEPHALETRAIARGPAADPHFWLDPTAMAAVAIELRDRLIDIDPEGAGAYRGAARSLVDDLDALDHRYRETLAGCARTTIVVAHEAFGWLAARYGLEQVGIAGIEPEGEPTPARVAEVVELVEDLGVTTAFFEPLGSARVAEAVAAEAGIGTAELDPLENRPSEGDYLSAMEANLDALATALECT